MGSLYALQLRHEADQPPAALALQPLLVHSQNHVNLKCRLTYHPTAEKIQTDDLSSENHVKSKMPSSIQTEALDSEPPGPSANICAETTGRTSHCPSPTHQGTCKNGVNVVFQKKINFLRKLENMRFANLTLLAPRERANFNHRFRLICQIRVHEQNAHMNVDVEILPVDEDRTISCSTGRHSVPRSKIIRSLGQDVGEKHPKINQNPPD